MKKDKIITIVTKKSAHSKLLEMEELASPVIYTEDEEENEEEDDCEEDVDGGNGNEDSNSTVEQVNTA